MSSERNKQHKAREIFYEYLKLHHKRCTPERSAMLDCAIGFDSQFSIDTFHNRLEATGFHVSLATIYNNLQIFVESGLIRRRTISRQHVVYEPVSVSSNGLCLVCTRCGKVRQISDQDISREISRRRYATFTPAYFTLNIYGLCRTCQRKERKEIKEKESNNKPSIRNHKK